MKPDESHNHPEENESIFDQEEKATCRICGCTDSNGCWGGCYWEEDDLCSKCVALHCSIFFAMQLDGTAWIGQLNNENGSEPLYTRVTDPEKIALFSTESLAVEAFNAIQLSENTTYDSAHLFEVIHENE